MAGTWDIAAVAFVAGAVLPTACCVWVAWKLRWAEEAASWGCALASALLSGDEDEAVELSSRLCDFRVQHTRDCGPARRWGGLAELIAEACEVTERASTASTVARTVRTKRLVSHVDGAGFGVTASDTTSPQLSYQRELTQPTAALETATFVWADGVEAWRFAAGAEDMMALARQHGATLELASEGALLVSFGLWTSGAQRRDRACGFATTLAETSGEMHCGVADGLARATQGPMGHFVSGDAVWTARACCDVAFHWNAPVAASETALPETTADFVITPLCRIELHDESDTALTYAVAAAGGGGGPVAPQLAAAWEMLGERGEVERGARALAAWVAENPLDTFSRKAATQVAEWLSLCGEDCAPPWVQRIMPTGRTLAAAGCVPRSPRGRVEYQWSPKGSKSFTVQPALADHFVAYLVVQSPMVTDAEAVWGAALRAWTGVVRAQGGAVEALSGDRLVARWQVLVGDHDGLVTVLGSAANCAHNMLTIGDLDGWSAGLACGSARCGQLRHGAYPCDTVYLVLTQARLRAEALANAAAADGLGVVATEALRQAEPTLPWRGVLGDVRFAPSGSREITLYPPGRPDCNVGDVIDVFQDGSWHPAWVLRTENRKPRSVLLCGQRLTQEADRVRLRKAIFQLGVKPASEVYEAAYSAIMSLRWSVASRLLHREMESASGDTWVSRLYDEVVQAEKDEEKGTRKTDVGLTAEVGPAGGLRFIHPAPAGKTGKPNPRWMQSKQHDAESIGLGSSGSARGSTASLAFGRSTSLAVRPALNRSPSGNVSTSPRPGLGRSPSTMSPSQQRWRRLSGGLSAAQLLRSSSALAPGPLAINADICQGPANKGKSFTVFDAAQELAELATVDSPGDFASIGRQESIVISEGRSLPGTPRGSTPSFASFTFGNPRRTPGRPAGSPRNAGLRQPHGSPSGSIVADTLLDSPRDSPRARPNRALLALRDRHCVRECLRLPPVPPEAATVAPPGQEEDKATRLDRLLWKVASVWNVLRLLALMWNCAVIPGRAVYSSGTVSTYSIVLIAISYSFDLIYWGDVVLNFIEPIEIQGKLVTNKKEIARVYIRSWFSFDIVCCLPWELCMLAVDPIVIVTTPALRFNRCLNLARVHTLVGSIREQLFSTSHPVKVQLVVFLGYTLYMLHWLGCLWGLVHVGPAADTADEWARGAIRGYVRPGENKIRDTITEGVHGFHWALRSFAGYGMQWPRGDRHTMVALLTVVIGIFMFATVIGYMWTLVQLLGSAYESHIAKIDELLGFCEHLRVDSLAGSSFSDQLLRYHRILWNRTREAYPGQFSFLLEDGWETDQQGICWATGAEMPEGLPPELARMMRYYVNFQAVETVPVLRGTGDPLFVMRVVCRMHHRLGSPGELLLSRGPAEGDNTGVFFLVRGEATLVYADGHREAMQQGAFWGEVAIIFGSQQGADLLLNDFAEVYKLDPGDFATMLADFPAVAAGFRDMAAARQETLRLHAEMVPVSAADALGNSSGTSSFEELDRYCLRTSSDEAAAMGFSSYRGEADRQLTTTPSWVKQETPVTENSPSVPQTRSVSLLLDGEQQQDDRLTQLPPARSPRRGMLRPSASALVLSPKNDSLQPKRPILRPSLSAQRLTVTLPDIGQHSSSAQAG